MAQPKSNKNYPPDYSPSHKSINVADPRLNRVLLREPERCATINEYAHVSGIETTEVIDLLGPYLDDKTLALEIVGEEIFVLTAPEGRPLPSGKPDVAPNLWERLRDRANSAMAYNLWKLVRSLETAGWAIETQPNRIMFGMAHIQDAPILGVAVGNTVMPLLIFPTNDSLASPVGLLAEYDRAGCSLVGVVCDSGALDETTTAIRRWVLSSKVVKPSMGVIIMEAPRYAPTLISPNDSSVTPRAINQQKIQDTNWNIKETIGQYGI